MSEDIIKLTERELEEIKDDVRFRAKTTETLNYVCLKISKISDIKDEVRSLQIHRNCQWTLISLIISGLFGVAFWVIKVNA